MKKITISITLALFFLSCALLPATNILERLKQTLSPTPPELFLVYPTQGCLPTKDAILRFNVAQVHYKKGDSPFKNFTLTATLTDANGTTYEFSAQLSTGHTAEFSLPELLPGEWKLVAQLTKGKRKEPTSTLELTLNVLPIDTPQIPGECHIDKFGRALVDGKPFLPIGLYFGSTDEDDDLDLLFDSDFNCIMPYSSAGLKVKDTTAQGVVPKTLEVLDLLNANGKKIIFSVKDIYEIESTKKIAKNIQNAFGGETIDETVTNIVTAFSRHPALLAWYDNDEISLAERGVVDARRQLLNKLDPRHPTWGVLCDYAETPLFASTCDVIGVDPYPIGKESPANQERCIDAMDAAERSGLSCWAVPQIFNWGNYKARTVPASFAKYHYPTLEQMRGIILYEALRGARGFICYSFYDLKRNAPLSNYPMEDREPFLKRWEEVKQLATMLKSLEPWLTAEKPPVPVTLEIEKGQAEAASFVNEEGKPLYILANIGPDNLEAKLVLPEGTSAMKALYGHATELLPGTWEFTGNDVWGELLVPAE